MTKPTELTRLVAQTVRLCEPRHDKTNKMAVRPAKTKISLGISSVHSSKCLCDVKMTLIICPGSRVFKPFIDNMIFHGIMA